LLVRCNCRCILTGVATKNSSSPVVSDEEVVLLNISEESFAYQMVSTPLKGHPVTMDIGDVVSSIHGNLLCICFIASLVKFYNIGLVIFQFLLRITNLLHLCLVIKLHRGFLFYCKLISCHKVATLFCFIFTHCNFCMFSVGLLCGISATQLLHLN